MDEVTWLRYIMFNCQVFFDFDWGWLWCHWVECDWIEFGWTYVKSLAWSNMSLNELGQVRRVGWLSKHLIRLTQVYDCFNTGTQAAWYRLVQLSKIGTSCLMCNWFHLDWLNCMSSWVDPGGLSLVCKLRLTELVDVRNRLIGTGWLYMLMSIVIQWTVIGWWVVIR